MPKKASKAKTPGSALAALRWDRASQEDKAEEGKRLSTARHAALTPERRNEIAEKAAAARWGNATKAAKKKR